MPSIPQTHRALIGLGGNLPFNGLVGTALFRLALEALQQQGVSAVSTSSTWRTPAWPRGVAQPDFYNAVAEVDAGPRSPGQLYRVLAAVEAQFGRVRGERWGARTLDLDVLWMEGSADDGIMLPHPSMHLRDFVLLPLAEIVPAWRHPVSSETVFEMLQQLDTPISAVLMQT